ncbi:MAG: hypothetical protein LBB79_07680 [Prevotellaceae bacterium]|jgi:hypothetical protein|nr:hypothetical protein [Prevotellaceae bacterium]
MKKKVFLCLLLAGVSVAGFAFEGNDDNVTRDYYVQLYQTQDYIPDFRTVFASENDIRDYKKLRSYLNVKEEMARVLQMAGDEYYYGLSYSKLYATDYIQSLKDELALYAPSKKILLRLNSVRPTFSYSGEFAIEHVEAVILPAIKERYREATARDSLNQTVYMQIQKNIAAIRQDIFQAEQAIYASLSPEFRDQDFRIWISLTFSGLIAVILFAFFLIIYRRSDASLYKQLLSSSGLQFITVFVLIIAIILFGILNVLGGSELAAILSGISGYILGKGGSEVASAMPKKRESEAESPVAEARETFCEPPDGEPEILFRRPANPDATPQPEAAPPEKEEAQPEEEKFFPGSYYSGK